MKSSFRIFCSIAILLLVGKLFTASAQVESIIGQISSSTSETFVRDISGDGRFVVMESVGDIATQDKDNSDGNREIFLFDYAQRRIFQITHTRALLTDTTLLPVFSNIRVDITNVRPAISNDGRWIVFTSNATTSTPTTPNSTNPGNFDANSFNVTSGTTTTNPLTSDGNTEIWLYRIPTVATVANLSDGLEVPLTNLAGGTFTRVTNTLPSSLPIAGTSTTVPIIPDDHRDPSINDDGTSIAFISNRDLVVGSNPFPEDNPEVFTYNRTLQAVRQVSLTPRGTILAPIFNSNPIISGNGLRVAYISNGNNPTIGMTGGVNTDRSEEIFFTDLDSTGAPTGTRRQVTTTAPTNAGDIVNVFSPGKRMSRDGRYIIFESVADLAGTGANQSRFGTFLYDTTATTAPFRQIGLRGDADSAAAGGDVLRYPTFSDYTGTTPSTIVFASRLNIRGDGAVPSTEADGLNPISTRPTQIFSYPINIPAAAAVFRRMTAFPISASSAQVVRPIPSNSARRLAFNISQVELGGGNPDGSSEGFYVVAPLISRTDTASSFNFATGASNLPIIPGATPTPTPTPTATPTPSPTPTPSVTPTPTPTPTPATGPSVQGLSPGLLTIMNITGINVPIVPRTAVGSSTSRRFPLPIELSGVTLTIAGEACGLKSVDRRKIVFVAPNVITIDQNLPVVLNMNGVIINGTATVVATRPDVFNTQMIAVPLGRALTENVTNRVRTREPYTVRTLRVKGGVKVPTRMRLYLTGVRGVLAPFVFLRIGDENVTSVLTDAIEAEEPGMYYFDFSLPPGLNGDGDVPVVFTIIGGGITYDSRKDDTTSRIRIL